LLYLSIAACWSNDLYREAATMGIELDGVEITVDGDFPARGSGSTPISVEVVVRVIGSRSSCPRPDRRGGAGGRDPASHPRRDPRSR
jgi:hypothetical protein